MTFFSGKPRLNWIIRTLLTSHSERFFNPKHYSRSRHENSTLDEHADFDTELSKIKLPTGDVGEAFPRTIKTLFSYDGQSMCLLKSQRQTDRILERKVVQLLNEYGLQELGTHLDNLNRFLTFIGEPCLRLVMVKR